MKVIILAGGAGTRLSEETDIRPKPMAEIGGRPIIWHIMKHYSHYGFSEFIVCLGYKGYFIKEYFANYFLHQSDVTIDLKNNNVEVHGCKAEPWKVTLVDTGLNTMTGGRIKRVREFIGNEPFMLTYGDGVSDINISKLVDFHIKHGRYATITTVQPEGRFGIVYLGEKDVVCSFLEKPKGDGVWVNGGFFVLQPEVFEYIKSDETLWERDPLERLASGNQLVAFKHSGFWKSMDTLRDKRELEEVWKSEKHGWKIWKE